jgi:hypothetical protein
VYNYIKQHAFGSGSWGAAIVKKGKNIYGLKVEKTLVNSPRLPSGYRRLFVITEHDIPLFEVNEWLEDNGEIEKNQLNMVISQLRKEYRMLKANSFMGKFGTLK